MRRTLTAMAVTGTTVFVLFGGVATANATTAPPRLDGVDTPTNRQSQTSPLQGGLGSVLGGLFGGFLSSLVSTNAVPGLGGSQAGSTS